MSEDDDGKIVARVWVQEQFEKRKGTKMEEEDDEDRVLVERGNRVLSL